MEKFEIIKKIVDDVDMVDLKPGLVTPLDEYDSYSNSILSIVVNKKFLSKDDLAFRIKKIFQSGFEDEISEEVYLSKSIYIAEEILKKYLK